MEPKAAELAAIAEEMSATPEEVATSSQEINFAMRDLTENATGNTKTVEELNEPINMINVFLQKAAAVNLDDLKHEIHAIDDISENVGSIAD